MIGYYTFESRLLPGGLRDSKSRVTDELPVMAVSEPPPGLFVSLCNLLSRNELFRQAGKSRVALQEQAHLTAVRRPLLRDGSRGRHSGFIILRGVVITRR